MRFNHHQHQKLKTRILIESSNGIKSSACVKTIQKHQIDKYGFVLYIYIYIYFFFFENHMVFFFPYVSMSFYYELAFLNDPQKKKKKKKLTNLFK